MRASRGEPLDHHGDFYELTFLNQQWSPGPLDVADPKVDIAAVNPWMLTMAGEVADGVHVHPIGEPGYIKRHVLPCLSEGAIRAGRPAGDVDLIVPVTTIVGSTDEQRDASRELARASLSFYGSTPNYAFIWDEAGFEGTTARIRVKQKSGDLAGMAAEITDDHLAAFCTEADWDDLADRLIETYGGTASRLVLYSAGTADDQTLERYGSVARSISERTAAGVNVAPGTAVLAGVIMAVTACGATQIRPDLDTLDVASAAAVGGCVLKGAARATTSAAAR